MKQFKNGQLVEVFTPSGIWSERVYVGLNGRLHVVALNDNGGALSHFYDTHIRAVPIKEKGWIAIFRADFRDETWSAGIYKTKAEALAFQPGSAHIRKDVIEIEWEETPDCTVTP